jgi:hypothetical protein
MLGTGRGVDHRICVEMLAVRHHDDAMSGCNYRFGLVGHEIEGARRVALTGGGSRAWLRGAAFIAAAVATSACSWGPDMSEFRLPNRNTFLPSSTAAYVGPVSRTGPVGPADLVDGQGYCSGGAGQGAPDAASTARGVGLEMTECEVVRSLGPPQSAEIGGEGTGVRSTVLTYRSGDRPGIYRFSGGRLKTIEQGDEPLPAVKKPPAKKPKSA